MAIAREAEPVSSIGEIKEAGLDREDLLGIYRHMLLTRGVEERGHILYKQGKIPGSFYTGRGNEAASIGIATAMGSQDVGTPLHRDMGVHIVRGVEPWRIFAQFMGRVDGPTRGRDGNVHMADDRLGLIAMVSHLPAMLPVAVGCALAFRIREEQRVALGWFGEGASARGDTHEAMNLAGVRQLPVVFICDNNQWAYSTPTHLEYACEHVADRAQAYGFDGVVVDGTDVLAVYREAKAAIEKARDGRRPDPYRVPDSAHGGPRRPRRRVLRPEGDVRGVGEARPARALPLLAPRERRADRRGGGRDLRPGQEDPERRNPQGGGEPAARARGRDRGVWATPEELDTPTTSKQAMAVKTYLQAISDGLRDEMRRDKRVFVIGEDVGVYGGAFKVTKDFQQEFGSWRVIDAPLSETAIVGGCTGAAIMGMRPVAEMQFADFISCAWDHLVTVAAKQHYRAGTPVPIVVRLPPAAASPAGPSTPRTRSRASRTSRASGSRARRRRPTPRGSS